MILAKAIVSFRRIVPPGGSSERVGHSVNTLWLQGGSGDARDVAREAVGHDGGWKILTRWERAPQSV